MTANPNLSAKLATYLVQYRDGHDSFPRHDVNYYDRFVQIDKHLNDHVHPYVNQGATSAEERRRVWLTDHGPKHIATVIRRASDLACFRPDPPISPYEAYLLLVAIHFHDVGNILGRQDHERRISEEMAKIDRAVMGVDTGEQMLICQIAAAHGGFIEINGEKEPDTISPLGYPHPKKGPRPALLAAILRLADEFSEDRSRTEEFLNSHLPPEAEAYHRYAASLEPITIDAAEHTVGVHFDLDLPSILRTFQRDDAHVYLIDEIFRRSLKMHREHVYCARFMEPYIHIAQIEVKVVICSAGFVKILKVISFTMATRGYPTVPKHLADICEAVVGISGELMKNELGTPQPVGAAK